MTDAPRRPHDVPDILLVGNYTPTISMGLYQGLLADLLARSDVGTVAVANLRRVLGSGGDSAFAKVLGHLDRYLVNPLAGLSARVVHIVDQSDAYMALRTRSEATIVTCHDLIPFRAARSDWPWRPSAGYRMVMAANAAGLRRATHVVCISEATRRDVIELIGVAPERTRVIHNGLRPMPSPRPTDMAAMLARVPKPPGRRRILCFGGKFYKNLAFSVRTIVRLAERGVDVDAIVLRATDAERWMIAALGPAAARFHLLPRLGDDELAAAYATADILLFPSLYEGFGWPILEAQHYGLPVVCGEAPALAEVAGAGAVLVSPEDEAAAVATILRVLESESERRALCAAGRANLARFEASRWDEAHRSLYAELTGRTGAGASAAQAAA